MLLLGSDRFKPMNSPNMEISPYTQTIASTRSYRAGVVTTSMALQQAKSPWNPNTILVPHGVDYDHFSRAVKEDLPAPADIVSIPRPRLGFFGLIRDWVDLDLLAEVVVSNDAALLELLNDRIRQIPGVQSTETSIYLNLYKQTYQWGTR